MVPNPMGVLNQKNLLPALMYQFEHLLHWSGTPYGTIVLCYAPRFHANGPTQTYYVVELQPGLVAAAHCASAGGGGGSIFSPNQLFFYK